MSDIATRNTAIFVSIEEEYQANQGWEATEIWEGTEAQVRAQRLILLSRGATRIRLGPKSDGSWEVRGGYPFNAGAGQGNYVDTMELEVSAVMRSVYQSPVYRRWFSDYDGTTGDSAKARATLGPIGDCARKYLAGGPPRSGNRFPYTTLAGVTTNHATRELAIEAEVGDRLNALGSLSVGEKIAGAMLFEEVAYMGVTSVLEYNQVFRRTVTAGSPQAIRANSVGAGQIWTTAELYSWEGIPSNGWFDLNPASQWHKDKPRVLAAYKQKTQLTYSYTEIVTASALHYLARNNAALIHIPY